MKIKTVFFSLNIIASTFTFANPPKSTTKKSTTAKKDITIKTAKPTSTTPSIGPDAIKFEKSNTTENIVVDGKDILLAGNDNKLTITGNVGKILITGKNNDITIVAVNEITITGSGNFVSWEKTNNTNAKPIIQDKGGYNNVEKRSGNAQTRDEN